MRRYQTRGYTLVELTVVVAMVGVLAALATYGVSRYILASKTTEAMEMIRAIQEAEEAYRQETFTYLPTSTAVGSNYFPFGSSPPVGGIKKNFACADCDDRAAWAELNVSTNHPVAFGYEVITGAAGAAVPGAPDEWGSPAPGFPGSPGDIWYVVYATSCFESEDRCHVYAGSSFSTEILANAQGQ